MLYGEHAVVYDHPCIVTAVDLRIQVTATRLDDDQVSISVPNLSAPFIASINDFLSISPLPQEVRFVGAAIKRFWQQAGETFGLGVSTKSQFSSSYGLGSSSAVTVATVKALSQISTCSLAPGQVFRLSYEAVLDAQGGIGSGFDVAAATYGGTIYFVTGGKVIRPIPVMDLPLVIGYTGIKAKTIDYVNRVAGLCQGFPRVTDLVMRGIEAVVDEAEVALQHHNFERAGQLMDINQGLLSSLGVSTRELDCLIAATRLNGAYGAKLSGAGGGDCIVAFINEEIRVNVEKAIRAARSSNDVPGAEVISIRTGADGVRVDSAS